MQNLFVYIIAAFNLLGIGAGLFYTYSALHEPLVAKTVVTDTTEDYLKKQNIFADKPIIYSFDPFMVNLSNQEEDKQVQVEINFEMHDERSYEEMVKKAPMVRDTIVKILAKKEYAEIASVQGKLYLKDNIASAVNGQLNQGLIKGVYFSRFFVQ